MTASDPGRVAIGLLGNGLAYDSDEGRDWAAAITALMTGVAYRRSAEPAAVLGPFAEFKRSRDAMLEVLGRHAAALERLTGRNRRRSCARRDANGSVRSSLTAGTASATPKRR